MMRIGDSERSLRRCAVISVAVTAVGVGAAAVWAVLPPPLLSLPHAPGTSSRSPTTETVSTIKPEAWRVALWRPFTDAAPAPPPVSAPLTLKVFSILRQADGITAAIDPGTGAGLVYAKVGERVGTHTVTAIDDRGIEVDVDGRRQRVELRP